jgi:hypothetical protein
VGTALEPFYRDAGVFGLFLGILVLSFGLDAIALFALHVGRFFGYLLVSVLCFCSLSSFFVSKLTTGAVVLALLIFIMSLMFRGMMVGMSPIVKIKSEKF